MSVVSEPEDQVSWLPELPELPKFKAAGRWMELWRKSSGLLGYCSRGKGMTRSRN